MEEYNCLVCGHEIIVNTSCTSKDYYDRIPVNCPACDAKHERYFDEMTGPEEAHNYDCPSVELVK